MLTWFNNLKLQNKLIATFLVIVMIGAISLGSSIYSLRQINAGTQDVANVANKLIDLKEAQAGLIQQELDEKHFLLTGEADLIDKHRTAQQEADKLFEAALSLEQHEETRAAIQALANERDTYQTIFAKIVALYNDGKPEEAIRVSEEESEPHMDLLHEKVRALIAEGRGDVEETTSQADQQAQTATTIGIISLLISIGLSLGIGIFVAHSISTPLATIVQGAKLLSAGDTKLTGLDPTELDLISARRDEMGNIGRAFSALITYLQAMAEAAGQLAQGNVSTQIGAQSDKDRLGHAFTQMISYQQQMADVAGRMAQGDFTAIITPQSGQDALGHAFSQMITSLYSLIGQVADTANNVSAASGQLTTTADQASQASQQVAATIQQVATGTTQQTQAVTNAAGNTEQLARAADGIAKGAQEQAHSVQRTSSLVTEMSQIVEQVSQIARTVGQANTKVAQAARHSVTSIQQTTQGMDTIRSRSLATADKVKEMGHRSKEISRIVETIDDIADKTDMLALNAAVEAARAGEHGRGFAVVAEQVRKLSEDSKGATRDISNLVERVQESVREAITAVENTVMEVGNGVQLAGDTAKSLQEILQATDEAAVMAEQIDGATSQLRQKSEGVVNAIESVSTVVEENTAAAEEMAAGAQEVMQAIEGVASVAEENSASAEEVSASSEEMSAQVEEVLASAQELEMLAQQLRTAVAQFRIEETELPQSRRSGRSTSSVYATANRQRPKTVLVGQTNGQFDEH